MSWLQIIHDALMVGLIAIGLMAFATLIVKAVGEEQRRNGEHAMKLLDKSMDKIAGTMVKAFKEVMQLEKESEDEKRIDGLWL